MRSILIVAAIATFGAGCAPAASPETAAEAASSNRMAGIGGTARVGGVAITPLAVIEDSRCPSDVTCVWAGRVLIRARIEARGSASEADMELGKPIAASAAGRIVLAAVSPDKTSSAAIEADDYRFTFDRAE